jgi:hypothetical protein
MAHQAGPHTLTFPPRQAPPRAVAVLVAGLLAISGLTLAGTFDSSSDASPSGAATSQHASPHLGGRLVPVGASRH